MKYSDLIFDIFASYSVFLTRLLTLDIFFSTAVNAGLVGKSNILGILPSMSVISALSFFSRLDLSVLYCVFKTNPLVSIELTFATN